MDVLSACDFPGNVRELESCVKRTAALAKDSVIVVEDFACSNESCLSLVMGKSMNKSSNNEAGYVPLPCLSRRTRTLLAGTQNCGAANVAVERDTEIMNPALECSIARRERNRTPAPGRCDGEVRLGSSQSSTDSWPDATADGLRAAEAQHRNQAFLITLRTLMHSSSLSNLSRLDCTSEIHSLARCDGRFATKSVASVSFVAIATETNRHKHAVSATSTLAIELH